MTDSTPDTPEAVEAEANGERPDLGRAADTLSESLTGSGVGSDTRAGSLQGGAATGSDDDTDQASVDRTMADHGRAQAGAKDAAPNTVENAAPKPGSGGDDVDAPTG